MVADAVWLSDTGMGSREEWKQVERLGEGGQSEVFLVRNPKRSSERERYLKQIRLALDEDKRAELATATWSYARPDLPSELGALKLFKIPAENPRSLLPPPESEEDVAIERLKNEIAVLNQARSGLPQASGFECRTTLDRDGILSRTYSRAFTFQI